MVNNPYAACYRAAIGKAQDMKRISRKVPFKERLKICAQHWTNSMKCALEDKKEDMFIVRFEDLLKDPSQVLKSICDHIEIEFQDYMLPGPGQKIPFGFRFRDRWYPLELDRVTH